MKRPLVLLGALLLSCGYAGGGVAFANPEPQSVNQNDNTVTGKIVDENGEPIVGASIQEVGTNRGTASDINGKFTLSVKPKAQLKISYLGYKTVTLSAKSNMNIAMDVDNADLDEVVVVGYGQQKKANLTGAVASVDIDKTLGSRPEQDVAKALQGSVPGLTVLSNSGSLDATTSLSIRGLGTLSNSQNSSPLIIVDGVPVDDLNMISGNDIASISVLKDASSSAIYGSRAAFGVILITTKQGQKGEKVHVKYNMQFAWDRATELPDYPSVPEQLRAGIIGKARAGESTPELFGMYFDKLLPYAEAWQQQHSGKKGYSVMQPYESMDNVGDFYFNGRQPLYYADYDIQGIYYNNHAPSTSHNVSVSGSTGKTTFYTSFDYDAKEDVMKINPSKRSRYGLNVNIRTDVTDWLTIGARVNWMNRHFSTADPPTGGTYWYLWRWGSYFIPSGIYQDADGNQYDYRTLALQKDCNRLVNKHERISLNGYIQAHITKDLTFNADYTYVTDHFNYKASNKSVYGMNWTGTSPQYIYSQSADDATRWNRRSARWTANAYVDYAHTWAKAHNFHAMVGVNGENYTMDYFYVRRKQLYDESYPELNLAYGDLKNATITSNTGDRASAGFFGRINYDYKGIYLAEFNGRYDGSSRFREGDRWAFFPSFSLGYRFTEEPYWKNLREYVSNGKLRFSFGEIGNEAIGDNMFISTLSATQGDSYNPIWLNGSGTKLNQFTMPTWVNSSLTWERIQTTNLGLDLGFLNNDLNLTFELYQRLTKDMLAPGDAIPSAVGASAPYTNNGQLRSRGWELSLSWQHQFNKDLRVYANASIGDSKVKVTKWNKKYDKETGERLPDVIGHTGSTAYAYEGETWGDIWGFETDRYFTEDDFNGQNADGSWNYKKGVADQTGIQVGNFVYGPGDIKYKDLNGDGVIDGGDGTTSKHGDLKVIGNTLPRYEYSFRLGASWKGIDIDAFFQGVGKRDLWTLSSFNFPLMRNADLALYANQTKYNVYDPANGIVNISESNDYPCLWPGNEGAGNVSALSAAGGRNNYYPQSKYLVHMSYLRLKSLTVGYTIPREITRKFYVENLRVYFSGNNLFLLHKGNGNLPLDPEINQGQGSLSYGTWGRTVPMTKSFAVGMQVTF